MNIKETTVIEGGVKYTIYTYSTGSKWCDVNGKLHRKYGPAIERTDGSKEWWLNNKVHRIGGPAVERADGCKGWYLNNKSYTKPTYYKELFKQGLITEEEYFLELV